MIVTASARPCARARRITAWIDLSRFKSRPPLQRAGARGRPAAEPPLLLALVSMGCRRPTPVPLTFLPAPQRWRACLRSASSPTRCAQGAALVRLPLSRLAKHRRSRASPTPAAAGCGQQRGSDVCRIPSEPWLPGVHPPLSPAGPHLCLRHRRLLLPPQPQDGGQGAAWRMAVEGARRLGQRGHGWQSAACSQPADACRCLQLGGPADQPAHLHAPHAPHAPRSAPRQVHNEEEIRRILPLASKHQVPVTFRAAGTSLSGQVRAPAAGSLLWCRPSGAAQQQCSRQPRLRVAAVPARLRAGRGSQDACRRASMPAAACLLSVRSRLAHPAARLPGALAAPPCRR